MAKHVVIYNCSVEPPSREIIAVDTIKHVWLDLPDRMATVIEYINPATEREFSVREYYKFRGQAEARVNYLVRLLCDEKWGGHYSRPISIYEFEKIEKETERNQ